MEIRIDLLFLGLVLGRRLCVMLRFPPVVLLLVFSDEVLDQWVAVAACRVLATHGEILTDGPVR